MKAREILEIDEFHVKVMLMLGAAAMLGSALFAAEHKIGPQLNSLKTLGAAIPYMIGGGVISLLGAAVGWLIAALAWIGAHDEIIGKQGFQFNQDDYLGTFWLAIVFGTTTGALSIEAMGGVQNLSHALTTDNWSMTPASVFLVITLVLLPATIVFAIYGVITLLHYVSLPRPSKEVLIAKFDRIAAGELPPVMKRSIWQRAIYPGFIIRHATIKAELERKRLEKEQELAEQVIDTARARQKADQGRKHD